MQIYYEGSYLQPHVLEVAHDNTIAKIGVRHFMNVDFVE
jgi:hypothetical protein